MLFEKKYRLVMRNGESKWFTAKEICKRVNKDNEREYNWFASPQELVKVCKEPSFPENYAYEIEIAILKRYASLEKWMSKESVDSPEWDAANWCYNSLSYVIEKSREVRNNYLRAVINNIPNHHFETLNYRYEGPEYKQVCQKWKRQMFEDYHYVLRVDFRELQKVLDEKFTKALKDAETKGLISMQYKGA